MTYQQAATRARIGKAAKAAHDWCRECRKTGRSPTDAALGNEPARPTFATLDETSVFEAVCGVLVERHGARRQTRNQRLRDAWSDKQASNAGRKAYGSAPVSVFEERIKLRPRR